MLRRILRRLAAGILATYAKRASGSISEPKRNVWGKTSRQRPGGFAIIKELINVCDHKARDGKQQPLGPR